MLTRYRVSQGWNGPLLVRAQRRWKRKQRATVNKTTGCSAGKVGVNHTEKE